MILSGNHKIGLSHRVTTVLWSPGKALAVGQGKWNQEGDTLDTSVAVPQLSQDHAWGITRTSGTISHLDMGAKNCPTH